MQCLRMNFFGSFLPCCIREGLGLQINLLIMALNCDFLPEWSLFGPVLSLLRAGPCQSSQSKLSVYLSLDQLQNVFWSKVQFPKINKKKTWITSMWLVICKSVVFEVNIVIGTYLIDKVVLKFEKFVRFWRFIFCTLTEGWTFLASFSS